MEPVAGYRTLVLGIAVILYTMHIASAEKTDEPAWQTTFNELYRLTGGENAKLIRPPFTAERDAFHRKAHPRIGNHPGQYGFRWENGKAVQRRWSSDPGTVASALIMADIDLVDLDGAPESFSLKVPGDWIVRKGAPRAAILADIQRELAQSTDGRIRIEPGELEKEVVVVRGRLTVKPIENAPRERNSVHLYTDNLDTREGAGGGVGNMSSFLRRVGDVIGQKVIDETDKTQRGNVDWTNNSDADKAQESAEKRDRLLKHLSEQTGLEFKVERRKVDVWRVIDTTGQAGGL